MFSASHNAGAGYFQANDPSSVIECLLMYQHCLFEFMYMCLTS